VAILLVVLLVLCAAESAVLAGPVQRKDDKGEGTRGDNNKFQQKPNGRQITFSRDVPEGK